MTADPQGRSHPPYRLDALAVFMLSAVEASKAALSWQISEWSINFQSGDLRSSWSRSAKPTGAGTTPIPGGTGPDPILVSR